MKCEYCDNEATVHFTQMLSEKPVEMHLCESCAEERGITDPDGFALPNMLGDEGDKITLPELKTLPECSFCGFTFQDLKKVGRLGCNQCYTAFGEEVLGMLNTMHRGTEHKGKRPEGMFNVIEKKEELASVKAQLEKAISDEEFEKAAQLRDKLKQLSE